MSSGAASSRCGARSACALSCDLLGRAGDRLAADRQRARAVGAPCRTGPVGVAVDDLDVLRVDAEPVGDDLRERRCRGPGRAARCRCRPSPSRSGARAPWPTPRRRPACRRPAGRPRATAPGRRSRCRWRSRCRGRCPARAARLLAAERVEVELLEQLVERALVVAGVVDDARAASRREVLLGDEVLAPQLERVHAELGGELRPSSPRPSASPPAGRRRGSRRSRTCS